MNENKPLPPPKLDDNNVEDALLIEKQQVQAEANRRFHERGRLLGRFADYEPEDKLW